MWIITDIILVLLKLFTNKYSFIWFTKMTFYYYWNCYLILLRTSLVNHFWRLRSRTDSYTYTCINRDISKTMLYICGGMFLICLQWLCFFLLKELLQILTQNSFLKSKGIFCSYFVLWFLKYPYIWQKFDLASACRMCFTSDVQVHTCYCNILCV